VARRNGDYAIVPGKPNLEARHSIRPAEGDSRLAGNRHAIDDDVIELLGDRVETGVLIYGSRQDCRVKTYCYIP
jgi:hypothetical protein